jgi:hypothetical protein
MREGCERTKCSMKIGEVREKELKQMFLLTGNAKKVVFQQQKRMEKCLLKSDVLTMENTAEEMVFQQRGKREKYC